MDDIRDVIRRMEILERHLKPIWRMIDSETEDIENEIELVVGTHGGRIMVSPDAQQPVKQPTLTDKKKFSYTDYIPDSFCTIARPNPELKFSETGFLRCHAAMELYRERMLSLLSDMLLFSKAHIRSQVELVRSLELDKRYRDSRPPSDDYCLHVIFPDPRADIEFVEEIKFTDVKDDTMQRFRHVLRIFDREELSEYQAMAWYHTGIRIFETRTPFQLPEHMSHDLFYSLMDCSEKGDEMMPETADSREKLMDEEYDNTCFFLDISLAEWEYGDADSCEEAMTMRKYLAPN